MAVTRKDQVELAGAMEDEHDESEDPDPKKKPASAKSKARSKGKAKAKAKQGKGRGKGRGRGRGKDKVVSKTKATGKGRGKKQAMPDEATITPKRKASKSKADSPTPAPVAKVKATFARRRCPKTDPARSWHQCVRIAFESFVEDNVKNPSKSEDFLKVFVSFFGCRFNQMQKVHPKYNNSIRLKVCQEPFWNYCNKKLEEDGNVSLDDYDLFTTDCAKTFVKEYFDRYQNQLTNSKPQTLMMTLHRTTLLAPHLR